MEKTFEEFITIEERIGKMLICGLEGYGKILLLSYLAVEKNAYRSKGMLEKL